MPLNLAVLVGSLRRESFNRRLAEAITRLPSAQGHAVTFSTIGDLPLYDQDADADQPSPVQRLKAEIRAADGVIFVTPEYNRSIPGVLKNAIDHASRPYGDNAWRGKPAAIIGTSPGAIGTAVAQQHLRSVLAVLGMATMPLPEAYIQWREETIDGEGRLAVKTADLLDAWLAAFVAWTERHRV